MSSSTPIPNKENGRGTESKKQNRAFAEDRWGLRCRTWAWWLPSWERPAAQAARQPGSQNGTTAGPSSSGGANAVAPSR